MKGIDENSFYEHVEELLIHGGKSIATILQAAQLTLLKDDDAIYYCDLGFAQLEKTAEESLAFFYATMFPDSDEQDASAASQIEETKKVLACLNQFTRGIFHSSLQHRELAIQDLESAIPALNSIDNPEILTKLLLVEKILEKKLNHPLAGQMQAYLEDDDCHPLTPLLLSGSYEEALALVEANGQEELKTPVLTLLGHYDEALETIASSSYDLRHFSPLIYLLQGDEEKARKALKDYLMTAESDGESDPFLPLITTMLVNS